MTAEEKDALLATYHPDYKTGRLCDTIKVGPNNGEKVPNGAAGPAAGQQPGARTLKVDLDKIDYDVDVLIIGGGGAGASAAIEADEAGANVMIVTKLRHRRRQHHDGRGRHPGGGQGERFPRACITWTRWAADITPTSPSCWL